ncbi:MAG: hypothetical protein ABI624_21595 [Casimicrobiaceae bacterium]
MRPSPPLQRLRALRSVFGPAAEHEKRALLTRLRGIRLDTFAQVNALHEDLLFLCAFPGARSTRALARRMLGEIGERIRRIASAQRVAAEDSGMAGSITRHILPYAIAQWLVRQAPDHLEIDWRNFADPAPLDGFIGLLLSDAEREAFDGGEFATRAWIQLARRTGARTDLEWLMEVAAASPAHAQRLADEWDNAEVPLAWALGESRWSATHNRLPVAITLRTSLRRPAADVFAEVARPLESVELLSRANARRVAASARAALAARCREVNAMTYPNSDEVWWCELGEGIALAVIGIARSQRLTLETNTGYLLFAQGLPIGYGGVTPLFRQANTGINIFDPFRGGEAAFLWTQMLRAFHTLFGSRRFVINAYQFGAGNAEAIRSGAFWFYYRLGFRPAHPGTRTIAAREAARMASDRKYRSDVRTLKALATGDLHFDLPGFDPTDFFDEALLPQVGAAAARQLAGVPDWSRARAERHLADAVAAELGAGDRARWPAGDRRGFEILAPVVASLASLRDWSAAERQALSVMMRAKGSSQERDFALAAARAARFHRELAASLRNRTRA